MPQLRVWMVIGLGCLLLCGHAQAASTCGTGGAFGESKGQAGAGDYLVSAPAAATPAARPLLLALHGDEGTPQYIYDVFLALQQSSGGAFILAAPRAAFGGGSWYSALSDNSTFMDAVIAKLSSSYNIDGDRIWVAGWSGGASFLTYYAVKRQDVLAAAVFYMGGASAGAYDPPPASCKIPGRFVIGDQDKLYALAKSKYDMLKQRGHAALWVEIAGLGHNFDPATLPDTWAWLQQQTLCGQSTADSCGPPASPPGEPPAGPDGGASAPSAGADATAGNPAGADAGVPRVLHGDAASDPVSAPGGAAAQGEGALLGGCAVSPRAPAGERGRALLIVALFIAALLALKLRPPA